MMLLGKYSNRQKKLSISLSSPNPRFEPKMECGPFARECCNLCPYWRAHCVLLDAGMRVRGGSMRVHSVFTMQACDDGSALRAQPTVCMHVQTGNTGCSNCAHTSHILRTTLHTRNCDQKRTAERCSSRTLAAHDRQHCKRAARWRAAALPRRCNPQHGRGISSGNRMHAGIGKETAMIA